MLMIYIILHYSNKLFSRQNKCLLKLFVFEDLSQFLRLGWTKSKNKSQLNNLNCSVQEIIMFFLRMQFNETLSFDQIKSLQILTITYARNPISTLLLRTQVLSFMASCYVMRVPRACERRAYVVNIFLLCFILGVQLLQPSFLSLFACFSLFVSIPCLLLQSSGKYSYTLEGKNKLHKADSQPQLIRNFNRYFVVVIMLWVFKL